MNDHDKIIAQELFFNNQKYPDNSDKYTDLLRWILGAVEVAGDAWIKKVKPKIKEKVKKLSVKDDFEEVLSEQLSVVTNEDPVHFPLARESVAGATFQESIATRDRAVLKGAIAFAAAVYGARNANGIIKGVSSMVRAETKRYRRGNEMFYITQTKAAREYGYSKNDARDSDIKGWISVAILDNRTSAVCIGFTNKYYPIKSFPTRASIPNKPPRHPRCRSTIVAVKKGDRIADYQTDTADNFLFRNKQIAVDLLGVDRYKIWVDSATSINNFIDLNRGTLFSQAHIRKRFL